MNVEGITRLHTALKDDADYGVFARGKQYANSRHVGAITAMEEGDRVTLEARVRGSEAYHTRLVFDASYGEVAEYDCTCPYEGDMCKHVVAIGLVYCEQEEKKVRATAKPSPALPHDPSTAMAAMRAKLAAAGIAAELFSDDLITQMIRAEQKAIPEPQTPEAPAAEWKHIGKTWTPVATVSASEKPKTPKPHKPFHERYDLVLSPDYRGYVHSVHVEKREHKMYWGQQRAAARTILKEEPDLIDAHKTFLTLVAQHEKDHEHYPEVDPTDYPAIIVAAREAGMRMTYDESYRTPQTLAWREAEKFAATIAIEKRESYDHNYAHDTYAYECLTLTLPRFKSEHTTAVAAGEQGLVIISLSGIELHPMSHALARIAARAALAMNDDSYARPYDLEKKTKQPRADLADDEYAQVNDIIADAHTSLTLTTNIMTPFSVITHEAKPVVVVDFRIDTCSLEVLPVVDYGGTTLPVSDMTYRSLGKEKKLVRRADPAFGTTHVVRIDGSQVHLAPVDRVLEEKLFTMGEKRGEELGLSKKCRFIARGENQAMRYLTMYLPALKIYAEKHGYELRYPHEIPAIAAADFRAEFDADMNAENDWFAFDLALYCGDERVTLADIEAFAQDGGALFKMKDGRLLKITNSETIAHLLELLAHFRRTGDKFEGKPYHAPALDAMARSSPHYNARHSRDLRTFLKEAAHGKAVKSVRIPAPFSNALRDYQKDGVHWIGFLRRYRFGGVLADDMGLGKTLQAIAAVTTHRTDGDAPSLVVAPKTLLHNWKHEVETFAPHLRTLVIEGTEAERRTLLRQIRKHDLVITSYPALQRDIEFYEKSKKPFHYCVLDEAQYIKNPRTKSAHTVKRIPSEYRLALTGTPLENSVEELWSIFDFLMPGFLGNHAHFQKHIGIPIMKHSNAHALEHLRANLSCFMLRRTKERVLSELPPKIEQVIECSLSDEQNILYQDVLARVKADVFGAVKKKGFAASQIHVFAGLTRLRQICNHPALVLPAKKGKTYPSAKLDALMGIVQEMRAEGRKVLVFSQFTQMLDIIADSLKKEGIKFSMLTGQTHRRQTVVDTFNTDPKQTVFLISTKAGGVGLNLTSADAVVIFDPWWNPQVERQAADRAHRIGQKKTVHIFRLRTKGTIEERIAALQERKARLFDALVGESKDLFKKLTWNDVQELLR